jgi:hypothetical protein
VDRRGHEPRLARGTRVKGQCGSRPDARGCCTLARSRRSGRRHGGLCLRAPPTTGACASPAERASEHPPRSLTQGTSTESAGSSTSGSRTRWRKQKPHEWPPNGAGQGLRQRERARRDLRRCVPANIRSTRSTQPRRPLPACASQTADATRLIAPGRIARHRTLGATACLTWMRRTTCPGSVSFWCRYPVSSPCRIGCIPVSSYNPLAQLYITSIIERCSRRHAPEAATALRLLIHVRLRFSSI